MAGQYGARVSDAVIRRILAFGQAEAAEGGPGADRGWRLALARAARDMLKLDLEVTRLSLDRRSLTELLELPPERALIVVLEGPAEGLGLLVLDAAVMSAMIEAQTIGKVGQAPLAPRKPTRTDAAMVAGTIDAALAGLELALQQEADLIWASGFRYASFLDDPRPLGLLLEDISYRVLTTELSLAQGARRGVAVLALPAEGRGQIPAAGLTQPGSEAQAGPGFSLALAAQIEASHCVLDAVLARVSLPLSTVIQMKVGETVVLTHAALDRIQFEGLDGLAVAEGKLGQNRGARAVRLTPAAKEGNASPLRAERALLQSAVVPVEDAAGLRQSA
ncbi:MAG: FliM/FliN family flagellar motor switch protein [Cypionkella sp.]